MTIGEVIKLWEDELQELKGVLYQLGDKADTVQYNLYAAEALRLSMCINEIYKQQIGVRK
jgi:hypothetical protein